MLVIAVDVIESDIPHNPDELEHLMEAADYGEVEYFSVQIRKPHPQQYLPDKQLTSLLYKLEELEEVRKIIFNCKLLPHQTLSLEKSLDTEIIDKPMLILEIFERRANTKDIKMQVQLAQLKYSVPRMVTKLGEAVRSERPGFGGSGEQVTDILISDMKRRIRQLERKIAKHKNSIHSQEQTSIPRIPIIGYYSAGKSTLFNILTESQREVGEEAFTTMMLKTGRSTIAGYPIEVIDTVGLVELPVDIINAFDLMLTSIFSFQLVVLCLDASQPLEIFETHLDDYQKYVERFSAEGSLKVLVTLTKTDICNKEEVNTKLQYVLDNVSVSSFEVIRSRYDDPQQVQQDFIKSFETLFDQDLMEFYYPRLTASQASKLHEIARIESQSWNSDGTTEISGVVPLLLFNQNRGMFS